MRAPMADRTIRTTLAGALHDARSPGAGGPRWRFVLLASLIASSLAAIAGCTRLAAPPPPAPARTPASLAAAGTSTDRGSPDPTEAPNDEKKNEPADRLASPAHAQPPAAKPGPGTLALGVPGGIAPGATWATSLVLARSSTVTLSQGIRSPGEVDSIAAVSGGESGRDDAFDTEAYARIEENPFLDAARNPLSTFSVDVDRASYSNIRRFITEGRLPPRDAVRIEEMLNYFPYDYPEPRGGEPFSVTTELGAAPWNDRHLLLRIGLRARSIATRDLPPSNLVFLIDVSGSMKDPLKLPLLKSAFGLLVAQLRPEDRVSIVVYAGSAGLVLPATPGSSKDAIMDAIAALEAGGSTAGGEGIRLAYRIAAENHVEGGNNRVILATDGDFNVGVSSDAEMTRLVEEKRKEGTFLTVLGFGGGNLKDSKMEQMADRGNGHYAYIDSLAEARKVLVSEIGGTLLTVAKDVKLQIEFNPARVSSYRLIGYENRMLRAEDFKDDAKDAGDIGAGHTVTALYEIVPAGGGSDVAPGDVDALRYQKTSPRAVADDGGELLFVKLRYKEPAASLSRLIEVPVLDRPAGLSDEFRFAAAVAELGLLLRDSTHKGSASYEEVIESARRALGKDPAGYRAEFVRLAEAARQLQAQPVAVGQAGAPPS